jgi:pSer/pThr/pTyr-binding forkhead associated (FHA) protein
MPQGTIERQQPAQPPLDEEKPMSHDPATFRISCGVPAALRLGCGRVGRPPEQVHTFAAPFVLVGRDPRNDLVLDRKSISQRHTYLQVIRGRVFFLDLKSRVGTRLGADPYPSGWLTADPLILWPFALAFINPQPLSGTNPQELPDPLTRRTEEGEGLPEIVLEVRNGTALSYRWRMTRELTLVGRQPNCKIHLVDSSVSAFHCSLVRTRGGVWVVDLLSRTGIQINGTPVKWAPLVDGDRLTIGQYEILVHLQGVPPSGRETAEAADHSEREPPAAGGGLELAGSGLFPVLAAPSILPPPAFLPLSLPAGLAELEGSLSGSAGSSLLLAVLHNMQSMQQQMFDHYQQSLIALAEVFARFHGDQMESVRREVEQLRSLTEELHQLQARLAQTGPGRGPAVAGPVSAASPATRPVQPALAGPAGIPAARVSNGSGSPAGVEAGDAGKSAAPPPVDIPGEGPQLHAWLTRRIDELQQERQSRWSRMVSFVLGK